MATETNVALLGYGTVGAAVDQLLVASADDIERATGHRLRLTRALVRDPSRHPAAPAGLLTTEFEEIAGDPSIAVVAEVMGGLEPAGPYVLDLLARGKHVVTANKQLVARRAPELYAAAAASGVQLRFEASVCAAIPVIKVLREALVVTNVHRVLGIVNGTTNFVLTEMEGGATYADALADAQARGYAEADPSDDVSGADAAAKMAIIATTAFGQLVTLDDVAYEGITQLDPADLEQERRRGRSIRLVGMATADRVEVRLMPLEADHPLKAVDGVTNAVLIEGEGFERITLSGPGAGGPATAAAVIADLVEFLR